MAKISEFMIQALLPILVFQMLLSLIKNKNPMKACSTIMTGVLMLCGVILMQTGMSMACYLILTVFLGGLMILYMIMTSILPNMKSTKSLSLSKKVIGAMPLATIAIQKLMFLESKSLMQLKMTSKTYQTMGLLIGLLMMYSLMLTKLSMKEESCLRMTTS